MLIRLAIEHPHYTTAPWIIVKANNQRKAGVESMRYVLSSINYDGKEQSKVSLHPNPNIITRFHRHATNVD